MCTNLLLDVAAVFVSVALALVLALLVSRLDERRETRRRQRILSDALARYYSAQHFWRPSPDNERREG